MKNSILPVLLIASTIAGCGAKADGQSTSEERNVFSSNNVTETNDRTNEGPRENNDESNNPSVVPTPSTEPTLIPTPVVTATPTPAPTAVPVPTPTATATPSVVFSDTITYWVNSNSTRVRSQPDTKTGKILGEVSLNDRVKVINPSVIYNNQFVEVQVVKTWDKILPSEKYFMSINALSPEKVDYKKFIGKYFVVVNVATETLRLYERQCADNSCPHKMVFETEVVVGEDVDHPKEEKGKGRSILGSYRVVGWTKFYQDGEGHYPAWYRDGYPATPSPDAKWSEWFSKKVMPEDSEGKKHGHMRGAFGWYTAFVEPEPFGQWTHGTLGWGTDKDKFIKKTKQTLINIVSDPRSSGCTRNNNEAIAFLRKMIDIGAPIIKVYAKEEILDPTFKNYPNQSIKWDYVLTKNKNHAIDKAEVMKLLNVKDQDLTSFAEAVKNGGSLVLDPKDPLFQVLEVGTYEYDAHPDAINYTPGEKLGKLERKIGRKGNVYGIKSNEMHGVFYVDAGMLIDYQHPDSVLEVSGFADEMTPPWMNAKTIKN